MPNQTRWQDVTIPTLTRWAKFNLKRAAHGAVAQAWLIFGAPGMGKTAFGKHVFRQLIADHLGVALDEVCVVVFDCNGQDEVDVCGPALPKKDADGNVYFAFPDKTPVHILIERELEKTGANYCVFILDEFGQGSQGLQKAARSMLNPDTHSIGGNKLGDNVYVIATSNRVQDRSGAFAILKHVPNVCKTVNLVFSMRALETYWSEHKLNPLAIECARAFQDDGFFQDAVPTDDEAYCTPRSLENVSIDMDVIMTEPDFDGTFTVDHRDYFTTVIGRGAADTLVNFCNQHDKIPSVSDMLNNPRECMVPDELGYQSIAAHKAMAAANDEQTANAAFVYIRRLRTDLQVPLLTKLVKRFNDEGHSFLSADAIDFFEKHAELFPLLWTE